MSAYYNENEPYAAQRLRNLINAGHIAPGYVDERSVVDVEPMDLWGFTQAHWFAGIGGWSYALRLAGVSDDTPIWTGSCPCQPFSTAGKRKGFSDSRHLWPVWMRHIKIANPAIVLGEQVASADGYKWLDLVYSDLEAENYAVGSAVIPAASAGAPHGRHRIFYVAYAARPNDRPRYGESNERALSQFGDSGQPNDLADANCEPTIRSSEPRSQRDPWSREPGVDIVAHGISYAVAQPAIRAVGNAIVPQVAAEFIKAAFEVMP